MDEVPIGVGVTRTRDRKLVYANAEMCRLLGRSSDELAARPALLTCARAEDERRVLQALRADERVDRWRLEGLRPDGSHFWVSLSTRPVEHDGEPATVALLHDITDSVRAEAEVRALTDDLERRVAERGAELERARDELLRAECLSRLGRLTASVGHELRNPLGTIRYSVEILGALIGDDPRVTAVLERLDRNVARCDAIIADLHDLTRSPSQGPVAVPLDVWVASALQDLDVPEGVTVRFHGGVGDRDVAIIVERMRSALCNLVANACQAIGTQDPATGTVSVETCLRGDGVALVVRDDGPGIAPERQEEIFKPLVSTKSFGLGLGLPLVRQIAGEHGGTVEVESAPTLGATFRLCWPGSL
jgi:PAS domain S-box-containing protein